MEKRKKKKIEKDCLGRENIERGRRNQEDRGILVSPGRNMCCFLGEEDRIVCRFNDKSIMFHSPKAEAEQGNKNRDRDWLATLCI